MHRGNDNIGCVEIELFPINKPLDISCFRLNQEIELSFFALISPLKLTCFKICSINKEGQFWMWDAGEILLWDNNIEIEL
jgi:hypothetical protein